MHICRLEQPRKNYNSVYGYLHNVNHVKELQAGMALIYVNFRKFSSIFCLRFICYTEAVKNTPKFGLSNFNLLILIY